MHRHIAELAVSLVANHRVIRQVALMYVGGVWVLMSTHQEDDQHRFSHVIVNEHEVSEVANRLDAQADEWRAAGHRVLCHHRYRSHTPALGAG